MCRLQNIGDTELDDWSEAPEKAWQFALNYLPESTELFRERILETKNWEWLVGGEIRELLTSLGSPLAPRPEISQDRNGQAVFQEYEPGRYRVWAEDGRLLLDGAVQGEDVLDGYAEIYDRFEHRRYLGQYMDGYRHGYGIEYFTDEDENMDYFPPFRMCDAQMVGGEVQVIEKSIQTIEEFCENWKPHTRPIETSLDNGKHARV